MHRARLIVTASLACLLTALPLTQAADAEREAAVFAHVQAFETAGDAQPDQLLREFEQERFAASWLVETTREERLALLSGIREAAATAGGAMVDENEGEIRLELLGKRPFVVLFRVQDEPPYAISSLRTEERAGGPELTWGTVAGVLAGMEARGLSGVLYLAREN